MKSFALPFSIRRKTQLVEWTLVMVGILALGYCVLAFLNARLFQTRETRSFARQLLMRKADTTEHSPLIAPLCAPQKGAVLGELRIPRLGVSVIVVEGDEEHDLKRAAGHIPGTALPGQAGNVGIAAHRDTFFRPLRLIREGDTINFSTLAGFYRYRVVSTNVVLPEDIHVLYPTERDSLTLVTCFPFDYFGSAPKRFIVRAERV